MNWIHSLILSLAVIGLVNCASKKHELDLASPPVEQTPAPALEVQEPVEAPVTKKAKKAVKKGKKSKKSKSSNKGS